MIVNWITYSRMIMTTKIRDEQWCENYGMTWHHHAPFRCDLRQWSASLIIELPPQCVILTSNAIFFIWKFLHDAFSQEHIEVKLFHQREIEGRHSLGSCLTVSVSPTTMLRPDTTTRSGWNWMGRNITTASPQYRGERETHPPEGTSSESYNDCEKNGR